MANNRPLHEIVLEVMFKISPSKPVGVSVSDVFWGIDIPELTEREVKEVMEWLVHKRQITRYIDKYHLDRPAYLELKKSIGPQRDKKNKSGLLIIPISLALVLFGYIFYLINQPPEPPVDLSEFPESRIAEKNLRKLYLNNKSDPTDQKTIEEIAYNFYLQRKNNQLLRDKMDILKRKDSVIVGFYANEMELLTNELKKQDEVQLRMHYYILAITVTIIVGFVVMYFQK
ncbi:MAG: DUF5457 domain-containing protein [Bacteroidota bacterium]